MNFIRKFIPAPVAAGAITVLLLLVIIFHAFVLSGIIPYQVAWGGRLESNLQMIQFESISIVINLGMLLVVAIKSGYLKWAIHVRWIQIGLWIMTVLFAINTIGNLLAIHDWERWIGTPLTLVLSAFSFRLAID